MENVNDKYLLWLMESVGLAKGSRHSFYFLLCRKLYKTPFLWLTSCDEDRAKDGMQLRMFFAEEGGEVVVNGPVSILEVLVAFSMRIDEWLSGGENGANAWFMTMLHNLGLDGFTDDEMLDPTSSDEVDLRLEKWVQRQYSFDGTGGIFPLRDPPGDQRCYDLEYQLQLYLKENRHLIGVDFG